MIDVRPHPYRFDLWGIWWPKGKTWLQHVGYESVNGPVAFQDEEDACRAAQEELSDGAFGILVVGRLRNTQKHPVMVFESAGDKIAVRVTMIKPGEPSEIETEAEKAQPFKLEAKGG